MPVVGERCENWQCFTSSGQEISRERKMGIAPASTTNTTVAPATDSVTGNAPGTSDTDPNMLYDLSKKSSPPHAELLPTKPAENPAP
jgi:hypothetical protein